MIVLKFKHDNSCVIPTAKTKTTNNKQEKRTYHIIFATKPQRRKSGSQHTRKTKEKKYTVEQSEKKERESQRVTAHSRTVRCQYTRVYSRTACYTSNTLSVNYMRLKNVMSYNVLGIIRRPHYSI